MNSPALPNSHESEMMVLGCMLTSEQSLTLGADALDENDFYYTEHKIIFYSLKSAYRNGKPADIHLIALDLKSRDKLQNIGGIAYLTTIAQYAGTSAYVEEYMRVIKDKSDRRRAVQAARTMEKSALDETLDVQISLDEAQSSLFRIAQNGRKDNAASLIGLIEGEDSKTQTPFLKELAARKERHSLLGAQDLGISGIPSHFTALDRMINGLNASHLLILAGRPAMGKTALGLNIAGNICFNNHFPVGIFSLEMTREEIFQRLVCSQTGVASEKITKGNLSDIEFEHVERVVHAMTNHVMLIDDQPALKITDLAARARRMKELYDIQFLLIDYLQLISGSRISGSEQRVQEISEISRMLKILARELDIPILCLSQLSRKVEERLGHKPQLSDLRESGSIEQDADIVMMLLRREYYDPNDRPGQAELIIAKNRHGAIGDITLYFEPELVKFKNFSCELKFTNASQPEAVNY